MKELSRLNSERAKLNLNPHHLGSCGYLGKDKGWDIEKEKGITPEINNVYNKRTRCFLLGRRKKVGHEEYILPKHTQALADELVSINIPYF